MRSICSTLSGFGGPYVAARHVFRHRLTEATRVGPWVSMPTPAGRIYYLNLRTSESRLDPPPLWEAGCGCGGYRCLMVSRRIGSWTAGKLVTHPKPPRFPGAIPRGREVCGGARIGVDVGAMLRPCVEQVLAGVFGPEDESGAVEQTETDICVVLPWKEVLGSNPGFGVWLDRLRLCVETLSEALADRFGLSVGDVTAMGWQQACPLLALINGHVLSDTLSRRPKEGRRSLRGDAGARLLGAGARSGGLCGEDASWRVPSYR